MQKGKILQPLQLMDEFGPPRTPASKTLGPRVQSVVSCVYNLTASRVEFFLSEDRSKTAAFKLLDGKADVSAD